MISIASLLIAAFVAFFSYYQIRIIQNERMTPYKAILFSEKLKAYQSVRLASIVVESQRQNILNYGAMRAPTEGRNSFDSAAYSSINGYVSAVSTQNILWPDSIVRQTGDALIAASALQRCLDDLDVQLRGAPGRGIGSLFRAHRCTRTQLPYYYQSFSTVRRQVDSALRANLRADQLQDIGG